jgi:hypothetical protein
MAPTTFTFIHASGTPGLTPSAAKKVRAHVTRSNFAHRRQRMEVTSRPDTSGIVPVSESTWGGFLKSLSATNGTDAARRTQIGRHAVQVILNNYTNEC